MATLVAAEGSSPRDAGARMWVDAEGRILGSVTIGGCVDARVIEEAGRVVEGGQPVLLRMSLGDEDAMALGMTCGGSVEVLIEQVNGADPHDPVAGALAVAERESAAGRVAAVVAPLNGPVSRLVVRDDGSISGSLGTAELDRAAAGAAREVIDGGRSGVQTVRTASGEARLYIERHAPPLTLVVFGATHVAMPLVRLARVLGLRAVVADGRERFATRARFPEADELLVGMPSEIAERLTLGRTSLVVLLAHDYKYDLPVLRTVLATPAAYVGVLGSARRGRALLDFLAADGVPEDQLRRVRVPVGLDIGARSPEEIALSVLAEALAVCRGRPGGAMRERWAAGPARVTASAEAR
jgi:xanthine dehydrogenase accessory factor